MKNKQKKIMYEKALEGQQQLADFCPFSKLHPHSKYQLILLSELWKV